MGPTKPQNSQAIRRTYAAERIRPQTGGKNSGHKHRREYKGAIELQALREGVHKTEQD
jgi:hypothetical protein